MAVTANQVQSLYLAYFGRPAEQAGLTYWTAQTNATVDQISAAFAQQPEYTATYGSLTRAQTINTLYQNLFGRTAQSNELAYWNNSADISVDRLALALTNGATGSDRLTLDNKVQFATNVTTTQGTAGTVDAVKTGFNATVVTTSPAGVANTSYAGVAAYVAAFTSTTVTAAQAAAQYYALANTALQNTIAPTFDAASTGGTVDFKALTSGTITLNNAAQNDAFVIGASATSNKATSLTINGSISAAEQATITEASSTKIIDTLTVNVSATDTSTTASAKVMTLVASDLTALKTIDASASTAGVTIAAGVLDSLTSLKTGSGADTVTVNTALEAGSTLTAASALTVDTGAGNDTVNGTVGTAALTINSGAGVDTLNLTTTGQAALTVNAGAGNDVVNLAATATAGITAAHVTSITLGDGNDTLNVTSLANLNGTFTTGTAAQIASANTAIAEDLVKVTDFSGTQDKMVLTVGSASLVTLDNTQLGTVQNAATLAEAVASAANIIAGATPAAHSTSFVYGGNTYVFVDAGSGNLGTVGNGDGLIELTGYTGTLTSANFATA